MGSYQSVINEATNPATTPKTDQGKLDRKVLLYRSYIIHGRYNLILSDITDTDVADLQAIKLLALYLTNPSKQIVDQIPAFLSESSLTANIAIIIGTLYYHELMFNEALELLSKFPKHLEAY